MKNPCYDPVTKTDCPRRSAGCSVRCPDWTAYVAARDREYELRAKEIRNNRDTIEPHKSREKNYQQKVIRNRMRGYK